MSNIVRLSLSLEKPLFDQLEALATASQYGNRSEFVRDLIRGRLVEEEWEDSPDLLGTISLVYDHHSRGLADRLTRVQHQFTGHVLANTHVHMDENLCAEMIMVRGAGRAIRALADRLRREKGVLHTSLAMGTTGRSLLTGHDAPAAEHDHHDHKHDHDHKHKHDHDHKHGHSHHHHHS